MSIDELTIFLGGKKFSLGDLLSRTDVSLSAFEGSVVEVCRRWIRGDDRFELTTSGSTGSPKDLAFSRSQMKASAQLTCQALGLKEGMTAMLCLDPRYIAGKMMIIRSLVRGMNIVVVDAVANPLSLLPNDFPFIDFAAFVPLQATTALEPANAKSLDNFGTIIIGGGPVSPDLRLKLQSLRRPAFYATFGMTETITHVALQKLNGENQSDYMRALPGIKFETDDRGCLVVHAPFVGRRPLATNDIVELTDQTLFRWMGRLDNVINSGGVKVSPESIEPEIGSTLSAIRITNRFFVCGMADARLGQEVVLVLEGLVSPDDEQSILTTLKARLPKYWAPRRVVYVEGFDFTPTGKVKRRETAAKASPRTG